MGRGCHAGQHWDALIRECIGCQAECRQPQVIARCTSYCESAYCKAQAGHYYDMLLKKCVRCADVCGGHPAECSQHCQTPTPPVITKKLLVQVTPHVPTSRGLLVPTALEDSTILLYSLLALSMMLLFSSLSLAFAVLLRGARAKTSKPGPKGANHPQPGQEVGQPGKRSKDLVSNSNHTTDREPSYDSSPTETCVCVHCFPDLKALGQGNDRPLRAPFSFYQQAVLHKSPIQKRGPLWTEENLYTSGLEVQEEAEVVG
ncbi:tumor necrosis factor receptor superfamily member 13B [Anarrhichthys ocellatus]|uniref:tumor necrosis factor receptor superfamily member 13B n=1 Tax=Anarrhichthys ocellatus TaxID=433405 RepID=UPI0012ECD415|nr:tumor necrosis factor receptor superfamily member 13B [Anarrhichthys ocellatus]XP_031699093.1 tumor necrosis factor receptor superfamily member 13B [Anarrhichthys ocellatus]